MCLKITDICHLLTFAKFTHFERSDKNGQLLLYLAQQCHVVILHTKFQKKTGQFRPTFLKRQAGDPN